MPAVSITAAQARAIAAWTRFGGEANRILIELESSGGVCVTRGSARARFSTDGAFEAVEGVLEKSPSEDAAHSRGDRFGFVRRGAEVRVRVSARLAMELAAYGAGEPSRQLGEKLLQAMEGTDQPLIYSATVKIEAPADQLSDPMAPVCIEIPDLDDSGDLFVVAQQDVERPSSDAGTGGSVPNE